MPVSAAFLLVVIIWSTTPLGIVWSSESISPTFSLLMRMTVAICVGSVLMVALKVKLQWTLKAVRIYLYSSLSVAIGMLFCYLAARHISSGLMSLTFGIAPILSGLLAQKILFEQKFSLLKKVALLISLSGLAIVCSENVTFGATSLLGLGYVFIAVLLFSLSSVLVKSVDSEIHPLSTTMGSLIVSLPFFLVFWLVADGQVNYQDWQPRAIAAVLYLGVFASLIGFLAYFFILQKLPASTVALVVMITPVISTGLGILLNDEHLSWLLIVGGGFVVLGLGLFQFGHKVKWFRAKA